MKAKISRPVKLKKSPMKPATAKGGAALLEATANRMRLWSDCRKLLPARRDPSQGYPTVNVVSALVHGLLCGGRGFQATEPMRGDRPALDIIGLDQAPSAPTAEDVVKYLARDDVGGLDALHAVLERQATRALHAESIGSLCLPGGFAPVFGDGSLLETGGKTKDCIKVYRDKGAGQLALAAFIGPYQVVSDFAREGEDERRCLMRRGKSVLRVLRKTRLLSRALFLQDSAYGDGPYLDWLERSFKGAHYVIGAGKLSAMRESLQAQPESVWRDTTKETRGRGWESSAVCVCYIQCRDWPKKRVLVGRRWKLPGELFPRYSGVITNLASSQSRMARAMRDCGKDFAGTVWDFYDAKQGMENSWKDLLCDMGLHHPPSGKAAANAAFFAVAALANNLSLVCRRGLLKGADRRMTLWRFRRDLIDVAATARCHAGRVIVRILDARERIFLQLQAAFERIESLQCVL